MTVQDGSIDECGTGRQTPPPTYQNLTTQDCLNYTESLLNPQNDTSIYAPTNTYEISQITRYTRSSAETVKKIYQMLEAENGVKNTLKGIFRMLELQDGISNTFIPIFSFILFIQLIISFANLLLMPYSSMSRFDEVKAVENLNLSKDDMLYLFNFARRHVLLDLKKCISQYL